MAEVAHTKEWTAPTGVVFLWEGATNGGSPDTFEEVRFDRIPYSIVLQVEDADSWAASSGPTITVQGSLDGTTYYDLSDLSGSAISITDDAFVSVGQVPLYIRPSMADGDSGTNIDVRMLVRWDHF